MNLFLFLLFFSAVFLRIRSTAFFSGLSDGKHLFSIQHLINTSNRKIFLSTAVRVVTADRVYTSGIRSLDSYRDAFFSGLSDGKHLFSILHLINTSNRKIFLSTAVRVVTADRIYISCIRSNIRSTAFFSGLLDGKSLLNILLLINASNRKKIGCTLLNFRKSEDIKPIDLC